MASAFQRNAFQTTAFQQGEVAAPTGNYVGFIRPRPIRVSKAPTRMSAAVRPIRLRRVPRIDI